jgi:Novel STAND NTPase 1
MNTLDGASIMESPAQYQGVGDTDQPEEFQKLLRAVLRLEPRAVVAAERNPFIGLQAYDSRRAHLFFGREQEINELVALPRQRQTPLVLVTGDSGSGKSSLVLAGLAARPLARSGLDSACPRSFGASPASRRRTAVAFPTHQSSVRLIRGVITCARRDARLAFD